MSKQLILFQYFEFLLLYKVNPFYRYAISYVLTTVTTILAKYISKLCLFTLKGVQTGNLCQLRSRSIHICMWNWSTVHCRENCACYGTGSLCNNLLLYTKFLWKIIAWNPKFKIEINFKFVMSSLHIGIYDKSWLTLAVIDFLSFGLSIIII